MSFLEFGGGELRLDRPDEFPKGVSAVAALLDDHGIAHVNFAAVGMRFQVLALDARLIHGRMVGHPPAGTDLEGLVVSAETRERFGMPEPDPNHPPDDYTLWTVNSARQGVAWMARGVYHDPTYVVSHLYDHDPEATALAVLINRIEYERIGPDNFPSKPIEEIESMLYERIGRRLDERGAV